MNNFDCIIIGGGASGLAAAVSLAKQNQNIKIAVLEALDRVGKKLAITGNGQCNITNKNLNPEFFHSDNAGFSQTALNKYGFDYTKKFFEEIGINIVSKEDGRSYPRSYQASSVVDALRFAADKYGIVTFFNTKVEAVTKNNGGFVLNTNGENFYAKKVVFACGLLSGGEKVGGFNNGIKILEKLGHKTVKLTPSIAQLKAQNSVLKSLKGIKTDSLAVLKIDGNTIDSEKGEILFTDYGLSGPAILKLSRECARTNKESEIVIDLFYEYSENELLRLLETRQKNIAKREKETFLFGLLQNRLARAVLAYAGLDLKGEIGEFTEKELKKLAFLLKNFAFTVTGNTGFINSQATAGGIDTKEVNAATMQSKKINGLYVIGELLDVDGDCGGYNLQWAWSSAFCAAESIAGEL